MIFSLNRMMRAGLVAAATTARLQFATSHASQIVLGVAQVTWARDVAFARARTQWKKVDEWLGKDVGAAIVKAAEQYPVLATPADEVLG